MFEMAGLANARKSIKLKALEIEYWAKILEDIYTKEA
jgi:hypothetical protein